MENFIKNTNALVNIEKAEFNFAFGLALAGLAFYLWLADEKPKRRFASSKRRLRRR